MRHSWMKSIAASRSIFVGFAFTAMILLSTGCATVRNGSGLASEKSGKELRAGSPRTVGEVIQAAPKATPVTYGDLVVQGVKLKNTQFDYPITVNSRVEYWVDYFTGRGRKHFVKYLERSEYFIPYIAPLLKQNNMPEDLVYLAMIESGFNNHARSFAKAVGPWQFMSATGKRYGLMVNWWVDERRDIRKSTLAAVEYLKDLYGMFQSWELAAAGYNAGENKIARAIQRYGTKDFWSLARHRFLRPETRDYVPKLIAAALISKNRELFGFAPSRGSHPGADEAIAGDGELVKVIKTETPTDDDEPLAGPSGQLALASTQRDEDEDGDSRAITPSTLMDLQALEPGPLAKPVPTPHVTKDGQVGGEELVEFDVKSPADLLKVARAAGLSYQTVKSLNPELLRWCTPPTASSFRLKLPASSKERFLTTYNHSEFPRQVKFMTYKVRKGETLSHVARHFGIHVDPISDLNGVSSRMPLKNGLNVLLPIPNDRSRSLASLDLKDPPSKKKVRSRSKRSSKYYKITYKKRESARSVVRKNSKT